MSALETLIAAVEANTKAVKENTALIASMAKDAPASAKPATPKEEAKPAAKATAPARATAKAPAEDEPKKPGRKPKAKFLSATEMGEKAKSFAEDAEDDETEFKARRAFLTETAKKYGVAKFSEIEGEDQADALVDLEAYLNDDAEDGEEGEEGDY